MNIYLSHFSALCAYEKGQLPASFRMTEKSPLPANHVPRLSAAEAAFLHERFSLPYPIQAAAPTKRCRRRSIFLDPHILPSQALRDQFYKAAKGLYIASPQLALLQIAGLVSPLSLVLLMSQATSRFAMRPESTQGFVDRNPLCGLDDLINLEGSSANVRGAKAYRRALSRVQEGCRSPAELKFALRLTLPKTEFNGFGFPKPLINARIDLSSTKNSLYGKREVDFLWPEAKLVVQYDSEDYHAHSLDSDARRDNEVIEAGYQVIRATAGQTADPDSMNALAALIASFVYQNRRSSITEQIRQDILHPTEKEQSKRDSLKEQLDLHFSTDFFHVPAVVRQQEKEASRKASNQRRRNAYQARQAKERPEAFSEGLPEELSEGLLEESF
ncbi:MAG: DUF559 domain-containing protein [Coriobacteriia bacterium]|nr:DUF559 domain-containing protein [Coriobacteriia bacterium]